MCLIAKKKKLETVDNGVSLCLHLSLSRSLNDTQPFRLSEKNVCALFFKQRFMERKYWQTFLIRSQTVELNVRYLWCSLSHSLCVAHIHFVSLYLWRVFCRAFALNTSNLVWKIVGNLI